MRVLEASGATLEQRLVVESGIGHEREYVRFWKRVALGRCLSKSAADPTRTNPVLLSGAVCAGEHPLC